jgi:O-antigen/teichoic acid export membrane protein
MKKIFTFLESLGFQPYGLRKYFANTSWLIFDRVLRLIFAFITTILIVRYLGPKQFGILSYAVSIVSLISILAYAGLENIITRELVKSPEKTNEFLGTGFILRFIGSILIIIILLIFGIAAKESTLSFMMILIIGASSIFQPFGVIDFFFQSKIQAKYSVIVQSTSFFALTVARILCIFLEAPLIIFAILLSIETIVAAIGFVIAYSSQGQNIFQWKFNKAIAREFVRDAWPLVLSGLAVSTFAKIDQVLLKFLVNAEGVGFYSAAVRIVEAWYFIPMAVTTSIFPALLNARQHNYNEYLSRLNKLYELMSFISIFIAIVVSLLSGFIIQVFYGAVFASSATVLAIYIWSGVATFLGVASNQFLIAENFTKLSLYRSVFGMITNICLNYLLIPKFGINGAAWATFISYFLSTFFIGMFKETRQQALMMLRSVFLVSTFSFLIKRLNNKH